MKFHESDPGSALHREDITSGGVSLYDLWFQLDKEYPDTPFIHVVQERETRVQKYTYSNFWKRVRRQAVAYRTALSLEPGDKIVICIDDLSEFALLLHGALLAGCVVIPVARGASATQLRSILQAVKPKVFVLPPALSAGVAALIPAARSVQHWVVTGRNQQEGASRKGENTVIKRLESILLSVTGDDYVHQEETSAPCGIVFSKSGTSFSASESIFLKRQEVLQKSYLFAQCLSGCNVHGSLWTSAEEFPPSGIFFNFFVPLFLRQPTLVRPGFEEREFWRQTLADGIQFALLTVPQFELLERKGKQRDWRKTDDFTVLVCDDKRLDSEVLSRFAERFKTPVGTSFFCFDLAEPVSLRPPSGDVATTIPGEGTESIPTYGKVITEAKVTPLPLEGVVAREGVAWGPLSVKSSFSKKSVKTGLRAAISEQELYVAGKSDALIVRRGSLINLARIDTLLLQLKGVTYARAVPYETMRGQKEFSVYVIQHRLSNMNKYDVELYLAEHLLREEMPASVLLEEKVGIDPPDGHSELLSRLAAKGLA